MAFTAVQDVKRTFNLDINVQRAREFADGEDIEVTRIDTPVMLRLPTGLRIAPAINAMALAGILAGHNMGLYVGQSVYFDQHSQLASLKAYDKLAEISAKKKQIVFAESSNTAVLLRLAENLIRLEPVYRQKYLKQRFRGKGILTPAMLTPMVLAEMFRELLDEYDLRRDIRRPLCEDQLLSIRSRFRPAALYWQHGHDILKMLGGNRTEYSRARSYLLENHSIDIYGPPPSEIEERVELGEILVPENFVQVPAEIRADPALFFTRDMDEERERLDGLIERWRNAA